MSGYVVDDQTISRVVTWLSDQSLRSPYHFKIKDAFSLDLCSEEDQARLARAMFDLNVSAVRQRYEDADKAEMIPDSFHYRHELATINQAYKSLRCWHYQCAEGDIPEYSMLYTIMGELSTEMAHEIAQDTPAYKAAVWG